MRLSQPDSRMQLRTISKNTKWLSVLLLASTAGFQLPSAFGQAAPLPTEHITTPTINPATTILPTDVLPLPTIQNRMSFGENLQLRILQKLPSRFYFTSSTETTFRYETNPFQYPTRRRMARELSGSLAVFNQLNTIQQQSITRQLNLPGMSQQIFRILPNVTAGFTLTPHTRVFGNYFMIHDSLMRSTRLNTVINSIAYGVQQDIPLGQRANLQAEIQFRELYQSHGKGAGLNGTILDTRRNFDYLPGLTLSYVVTPRTVAFINALIQIRGKEYFQAPTREFDPFYTWGMLHQRGGWSFSASTTFVQNFREQFHYATIRQNNYSFISDFEVARRLFRQVPGLQAFVRAEPIWNFHSRYRPGLSGMDFRLFYGIRVALSKPALTSALDSLRRQLEEQEVPAPGPGTGPKPSAYLQPEELIANSPQPIHGFLADATATAQDSSTRVLTAKDEQQEPVLVPAAAHVEEQANEYTQSPATQVTLGDEPEIKTLQPLPTSDRQTASERMQAPEIASSEADESIATKPQAIAPASAKQSKHAASSHAKAKTTGKSAAHKMATTHKDNSLRMFLQQPAVSPADIPAVVQNATSYLPIK